MNEKQAFVIMVQNRWWNAFCRRNREGKTTHSFVLRGFAPPKDASKLLFYVTKPVGELAGYAEFVERRVGDPAELWNEHGNESVLNTKKEYDLFINDSQRVSFVRFKDLQLASRPIPLSEVLMSLGTKRMGRKGFYLDKNAEERFLTLMREVWT
jgi:predicted transcriptional regulator